MDGVTTRDTSEGSPPYDWHGFGWAFAGFPKMTLAGTPSARSVRCSPAGSRSSRMVTYTVPSVCLTTVHAVRWMPG